MITEKDLLDLKERFEEEMRMAKAKIAVVDELLLVAAQKPVEEQDDCEQVTIEDESPIDESY